MLRIMKGGVKLSYIEKVLVNMRAGGVSTNGLSGYVENLKESHRALKNNKIKCALFVDLIRIVKTVLQMIFK